MDIIPPNNSFNEPPNKKMHSIFLLVPFRHPEHSYEAQPSTPSNSAMSCPTVDISSFIYTSCYCEENVYMLCKKLIQMGLADSNGSDLFVVFISNGRKQVPLWCQKASTGVDGLVLWDYHVICVQMIKTSEGDSDHVVWDLDSILPFPSTLDQYLNEAIRPTTSLSSAFRRLFRVIHAPVFLKLFASDRRHMKDPLGNWIYPPPSYEAIISEEGTLNNLDEYMQVAELDDWTNWEDVACAVFLKKLGVVVDESQFKDLLSRINSCK